jgi:hypothetical protein
MVVVREIEAKNFVLKIWHLGRREPVVQPTIQKEREEGGECIRNELKILR